ncbi:MAG: MarR family transcriptional regulator [Sneathiella sp.]|nr:MAG: MarR family transcriptional regulator [Sneathiella sp.]
MNAPTDNQAAALRTAIDAMMRRFKVAESEVSDSKPLNQIDMQVMLYVSAHLGCGPTDVARYLGVAPTTISSATDRLASQDFLQRDRPNENRRSIALSLTSSGTRYVSNLISLINGVPNGPS